MANYKRVLVSAAVKRCMLVACFAVMVIEYESATLFLWPLDHSCAKPANFSIFSEVFVDSKSQPIDLDAVQRNLLDATPEDSFTLARAKSLGIDYDDVAHCYEYAMDYDDDNQPVASMEKLEPCRFGLHFEVLTPKMSIIDHYNLACERQWLKVLLPQSFAVGVLLGLVGAYFVWYRREVCGQSARGYSGRRRNNLASWTSVNLVSFLALYLMTLVLNQSYLISSYRKLVPGGEHKHSGYFLFVACVFLRSAIVSSIMCRVMVKWRATTTDQMRSLGTHHEVCLAAFAITLVALKICFVPAAMKLFDSWSKLTLFLTLSRMVLLALTFLFELIQTRNKFHTLFQGSLSQFETQNNRLQQSSLTSTGDQLAGIGGVLHGNQQQAESTNERAEQVAGQAVGTTTPRFLLEIGEMRDTTRAAWTNYWGAQRLEPVAKVCEFCSAKDQRIFGIMNQRNSTTRPVTSANSSGFPIRAHRTSGDWREMTSEIGDQETGASGELDESSPTTPYYDNSNAYRPTTVPLDEYDDDDDVTAEPVGSVSRSERSSSLMTPPLSELASGPSVFRDSLPSATSKRMARVWAGPSLVTGARDKLALGAAEHNSSLFELSIGRWPLMSKMSLLTFCLAFNYFLVQTIPDHKLLHTETLSSLMDRKINHRSAESAASSASEPNHNGTTGKIEQIGARVVESAAATDKAVKFVYSPHLVTRDRVRPAPSSPSVLGDATQLNLTGSVGQVNVGVADPREHHPARVVSTRPTSAADDLKLAPVRAASESASRDKPIGVNNRLAVETIDKRPLKNNETAMNKSEPAPDRQREQGELHALIEGQAKYWYNMSTSAPTPAQLAPDGTKPVQMNSRLFNYNSVDDVSRTVDRLVHSRNPLELGWVMMNLNGWPVELLVILLQTSQLTNFESTYFKLTRLFSLVVYGSKLLVFEWLIVALIPKQNHLLEVDELQAILLLVARLATTLMLYSHLRMLLKLGAKLASSKLIAATIETSPLVVVALALALWAPIFEKTSLILVPLLLVANNLIVHHLARAIDDKFKALLCPMMFD